MECTIVLKKNAELVDDMPKAPTSLEYGELALNYSVGKETIFLKNSNGDIFSFDLNSAVKLKKDVIEDEEVVANAIEKISTASGIIKDDGTIGYECNGTNYMDSSKSLIDAIKILDSKLKEIENKLV